MSPTVPEKVAPTRKQTTRQMPLVVKLISTWPLGPTTLVAVKKMRTASGTTMTAIVLNWRARNASAPSWMALAISCILALPLSAASTPRAKMSPVMMPITPTASTAYSHVLSLPDSTNCW
jgi:hypothetical protein